MARMTLIVSSRLGNPLWHSFAPLARLVNLPLLVLASFAFIPLVNAATARPPCPPDPYANPAADYCNPLRYIAPPSLTTLSFSGVVLVGIIQAYLLWKTKAWYMLSMVIGCFTFAVGLGLRWGLHDHPYNKTIYVVYYLFVVLSPCAFIAANYVLLGRIARHFNVAQHLRVPAHRLTVLFLTSDMTTFLIQAIGGGISSSTQDPDLLQKASRIIVAGLALQLLSFVIFTTLFLLWLWKVYTLENQVWLKDAGKPWYNDWRGLVFALIISCIGILIRSTYRTVELSEGFQGYLAIHEVYFFTLDTLPLFLAVAVYVAIWPGRFFPSPAKENTPKEKRGGSNDYALERDDGSQTTAQDTSP